MQRLCLIYRRSTAMPPLTPTAEKFLKLVQDDNHDRFSIFRLIAKEPLLANQVIRVASSSAFGTTESVATLEDAIRQLGTAHLATICFALSLNEMPRRYPERTMFQGNRLARNGLFIGFLSAAIVTRSSSSATWNRAPEELFCAALLRNLHFAFLTKVAPGIYDKVAEFSAPRAVSFADGFELVFNNSSAGLAASMLKGWRVPLSYQEIVAKCIDVRGKNMTQEGAAIALASELAYERSMSFEQWDIKTQVTEQFREMVGLSKEELTELAFVSESETNNFLNSLYLAAA